MTMYILVGNIASGKSTYANKLAKEISANIINQDILGTRQICLECTETSLKLELDVIIDRTNINKFQRSNWINLAKKYNCEVEVVEFITKPEKCLERSLTRKDHPTIKDMPEEKIKSIINKFCKDYEAPDFNEGVRIITRILVDS